MHPLQMIFIGIVLLLLAYCGLRLMSLWLHGPAALGTPSSDAALSAPAAAPAHILSSCVPSEAVERRPASDQTVQTADQTVQTEDERDIKQRRRGHLLAVYAELRVAGVTREKAAPILKVLNLPLDNNLWTEARPETEAVTPIAQRPYNPADYHQDQPELQFALPNAKGAG